MNTGEVTRLLAAWQGGEQEALGSLFDEIFAELKVLAKANFRAERPNHTLQPTALVNEVYLRLQKSKQVDWKNRAYFYGACSQMMRRILIDHARRRKADRNGGEADHMSLENFEGRIPQEEQSRLEILALDQALTRLEDLDERQARIVELRFFGGLTIHQTAEVLGVSPTVIKRGWTRARAFLNHELGTI